jgi:hypothetical protein
MAVPALRRAADGDRLFPQLGVQHHLHGGVEAVQVGMQDHAGHGYLLCGAGTLRCVQYNILKKKIQLKNISY